jgi:hypothetical protein
LRDDALRPHYDLLRSYRKGRNGNSPNDGDAALRDRLAAAGPVQAARFSQGTYLTRLEAMYAAVLAGAPGLTSR